MNIRIISTLLLTLSFLLTNPLHAKQLQTPNNFNEVKEFLWDKYRHEAQSKTNLKTEFDTRELKFNDKTMRISLAKMGAPGKNGYPLFIALHGGGHTSPWVNDSQWQAMKTYYLGSVSSGIYIAPRGISDSWKLHSEDESYPLYDKLIEAAILYANVDPNRVYILGFSAGGDGVYQVTPKMGARFAAANMSAGHNNKLTFDNLYNVPFLLQVGELDSAYDRNHVTAQNYGLLNQLHDKYQGGYLHDAFIHINGSHNSWQDNDVGNRPKSVIANPLAWLNGERKAKSVKTNAISWLNQFERNPLPHKIVWDLNVYAKLRTYQTGSEFVKNSELKLAPPNTLHYWLDVSGESEYPLHGKLVAEINNDHSINISEVKNLTKFRILLHPDLLDFKHPIKIYIENKLIGEVTAKQHLNIMVRTLFERSDKNEIYADQVDLAFNDETNEWEIANA